MEGREEIDRDVVEEEGEEVGRVEMERRRGIGEGGSIKENK